MLNNTGDLEIIRSTCWIWFQSKLAIILSKLAFLTVHVYILVIINEFYKKGMDLNFILPYGTSIFSYSVYTCIMYIYILQREKIESMDNYVKQHFYSFSSRGEATKRKIMEKTRIGKYLALIQVLVTTVNVISYLPINSDRNGILIMKMVVEREGLSKTLEVLHFFFYYTMQFIYVHVICCYCNVMLYFVLHLHLQYVLLIEGCNTLEEGLISENMEEDEDYHRKIEERLTIIARHYQIIIRFQIQIAELFKEPMYIMIWVGLLMLMFVSYLLFMIDLGPDIICAVLIWVGTVEIALMFATIGQFYGDQKLYLWDALMNCNWINWNLKNKKTYLMFLHHVNKEQLINPGGQFILNWSLFLWFGRKAASLVAFLSTVEEINNSHP